MIEQTRRGLITGLISFVASPAIVRASSIMPIKPLPLIEFNNTEWKVIEKFILTFQSVLHHAQTGDDSMLCRVIDKKTAQIIKDHEVVHRKLMGL
jgi:hypothetical protein